MNANILFIVSIILIITAISSLIMKRKRVDEKGVVITGYQTFSHWGFALGIISVVCLFLYFLMMLCFILSPIGIIISIANFVVSLKQGNKHGRNLAIIGFILNSGALIYLIYFLKYYSSSIG